MDFNSWDLDDSSMSWRVLKSHYEDEEEEEEQEEEVEDEEGVYPCPFCSEDFDVAELVEYHIQEYHIGEAPPSRSYNGFEICPVCAIRVRSDMVEHLITKHRNSLDVLRYITGSNTVDLHRVLPLRLKKWLINCCRSFVRCPLQMRLQIYSLIRQCQATLLWRAALARKGLRGPMHHLLHWWRQQQIKKPDQDATLCRN